MTDIPNIQEIERRCKAKGWSVSELCRRAKISQNTFARWKNGSRHPSLEKYQQVLALVPDEEGVD